MVQSTNKGCWIAATVLVASFALMVASVVAFLRIQENKAERGRSARAQFDHEKATVTLKQFVVSKYRSGNVVVEGEPLTFKWLPAREVFAGHGRLKMKDANGKWRYAVYIGFMSASGALEEFEFFDHPVY